MKFSKENIDQWIESNRKKIIETYKEILRIPALSPENGGDGEWEKATKIIEILTEWGWENWIKTVSIPDERVSKKSRPNIIITYNPNNSTLPAICSVGHMDVVPVGEIAQWDHDPFDPIEKNGKLYGRGTEDNGLGLITPLAALKCIIDLKLHVSRPIKLILVADEETGSRFGIQPLIEQKLFQSDDLIIVPDAGVKSGLEIEIAEKTPLRAKITTNGLQGHAARPNDALNTQPIANLLATRFYDQLHKQFNEQNELFYPPISTFEPTMRRNNVSNVNTLPGRDEQWWDCRLIPETNIDDVKETMSKIANEISKESGAEIKIDFRSFSTSPIKITAETPVVNRFQKALNSVIQGKPKLVGIGGGTCASFFRNKGIPAIVWGHMDHVAHQTNEYCVLNYLFTDISIFIHFFLDLE